MNGVCVLKISQGVALDQFLRNCITGEEQVYIDTWSQNAPATSTCIHYQFSTRVQGGVQHRVGYDLFVGYRGP